eukprot:2521525-Rhodomonas_salina.2
MENHDEVASMGQRERKGTHLIIRIKLLHVHLERDSGKNELREASDVKSVERGASARTKEGLIAIHTHLERATHAAFGARRRAHSIFVRPWCAPGARQPSASSEARSTHALTNSDASRISGARPLRASLTCGTAVLVLERGSWAKLAFVLPNACLEPTNRALHASPAGMSGSARHSAVGSDSSDRPERSVGKKRIWTGCARCRPTVVLECARGARDARSTVRTCVSSVADAGCAGQAGRGRRGMQRAGRAGSLLTGT